LSHPREALSAASCLAERPRAGAAIVLGRARRWPPELPLSRRGRIALHARSSSGRLVPPHRGALHRAALRPDRHRLLEPLWFLLTLCLGTVLVTRPYRPEHAGQRRHGAVDRDSGQAPPASMPGGRGLLQSCSGFSPLGRCRAAGSASAALTQDGYPKTPLLSCLAMRGLLSACLPAGLTLRNGHRSRPPWQRAPGPWRGKV